MTEPTVPTYRPATCRRCKGTGQHSNYGGDTRCFDCKGTGVVQVESGTRPMTADERKAHDDFMAGVAAREARDAARAARQAARKARNNDNQDAR